jgi:hypothetical protein
MENLIRLLMRFILVPLGYLAAAIAGTLVVLVASWQLLDIATSGHPDAPARTVFTALIGGPFVLVFVLVFMLLPASIGILISEAFAIRSWIFHVLNGVVSAWLGWLSYGFTAGRDIPFNQPMVVIAAGIAGGFAYWAVAGFSAGFYKPIFRRDPPRHPCPRRRRSHCHLTLMAPVPPAKSVSPGPPIR